MKVKALTVWYRTPLFLFLALGLLIGCGDSRQLTEEQLDGTIMLVESERGAPQDWITLREWKDKLTSQPKVVEVADHFSRNGKNFGLQIEIRDKDEDLVFMFEQKEGKLHPSHIGGEDGVVRVKSGMGKFMAAAMIKASIGVSALDES
jgi:hypothetical protein